LFRLGTSQTHSGPFPVKSMEWTTTTPMRIRQANISSEMLIILFPAHILIYDQLTQFIFVYLCICNI
jgi:hypothetical protein